MGHRLVHSASLVLTNSFLQTLMTYHLVLYVIFLCIYRYAIDFNKHFHVEGNIPASISIVSYFTLLTQTTVMTEITPRTTLARSLVSTHIFLSWFIVILSMTPVGDDISNNMGSLNY
jgi:hypothetical protein